MNNDPKEPKERPNVYNRYSEEQLSVQYNI